MLNAITWHRIGGVASWRVEGAGRQGRRERAGGGARRRSGSVRSVGLQGCGSFWRETGAGAGDGRGKEDGQTGERARGRAEVMRVGELANGPKRAGGGRTDNRANVPTGFAAYLPSSGIVVSTSATWGHAGAAPPTLVSARKPTTNQGHLDFLSSHFRCSVS